MESQHVGGRGGVAHLSFFQHKNLVGGERRIGQNSFRQRGEEPAELQGNRKEDGFFQGQPEPGKGRQNDFGGVFHPSGRPTLGTGDIEGEIPKRDFGAA